MFKQLILGSPVGRAAIRGRAAVELLRAPKEELGALANDQLAERLVTRLCAPGRMFLDVGAHIGSIVAAVARHCPTARIVAVEAIPEKAARLRRKFPKAEVHCCALAEREGEAAFFVDEARSGYSSLARGGGSRLREIRVPLTRLDTLMRGADVDLVKIDVEGAELGVLRGAEALMASARPAVMFESGPADALGYTKPAMWTWFAERGYEVLVPNRLAHTAPPLSLEGFIDSHHYPRRTTNYFAVPAERRAELRARARRVLGL